MMRFVAKPEPKDFDKNVRFPGTRALKELRGDPSATTRRGRRRKAVAKIKGSNLPEFWTRCLVQLRDAFGEVCAYSCIWIDAASAYGTVDHFKHKAAFPDLAYEWSNFRYASQPMNQRKDDDLGLCDPFQVRDGDFVLDLVTFAVAPASEPKGAPLDAVRHTIDKLELDSQTMRARREAAWELFVANPNQAGWDMLVADCPFVAREYVRQRGIPPEATAPPPARFRIPDLRCSPPAPSSPRR
jgi:hypothetical protein